jgi:hypothetical protein
MRSAVVIPASTALALAEFIQSWCRPQTPDAQRLQLAFIATLTRPTTLDLLAETAPTPTNSGSKGAT